MEEEDTVRLMKLGGRGIIFTFLYIFNVFSSLAHLYNECSEESNADILNTNWLRLQGAAGAA